MSISDQALYMILDGARLEHQLPQAKKRSSDHVSLYKGKAGKNLDSVAPYVFDLSDRSEEFRSWMLQFGWGRSWGIFVGSTYSMIDLQDHFRRFLMVRDEDGKQMYFRFYDPRVLRVFLPSCDVGQLEEMFGQVVSHFFCEDENPNYVLDFTFDNGKLKSKRVKADKLFAEVPYMEVEEELPVLSGPKKSVEEKDGPVPKAADPPIRPKETKKTGKGKRFRFID